ncbi:hypothetical protein ES707_18435 [subsurface metagenome]
MTYHRKLHRLPVWIRSEEFRLLNAAEKDFLGYLYCFGPNTCWQWNCRLQKKFHCCRRTIQYRLAKLKKLKFIWISEPFGSGRKIHARLFPTPRHYFKLRATIALNKPRSKYV